MMQHVAHRHSDEIHELQAKIERLEAALKELRGVALHNDVLHPPSVVKFIDAALEAVQKARSDVAPNVALVGSGKQDT